jgi:ethanolamine ammonia-lyase small subunit
MPRELTTDLWSSLRATTGARIGLRRSGDALALAHVLDLQQAHAAARDAVHTPLDIVSLEADLHPLETLRVRSRAVDRPTYLRRPDLGRRLDPISSASLARAKYDAVFVIGDGLSAAAAHRYAAPLLLACLARLPNWCVAPVVVAEQARVALGDDIGGRLGAHLCVMLIGERPGLTVAQSLGAYLTWAPRVGQRDHERNCVSNIHATGLGIARAADTIVWIMQEALRLKLTGVALKENVDVSLTGPDAPMLP